MSKNTAIRLAAFAALSLAFFGATGTAAIPSSQVTAQSANLGALDGHGGNGGGTDW